MRRFIGENLYSKQPFSTGMMHYFKYILECWKYLYIYKVLFAKRALYNMTKANKNTEWNFVLNFNNFNSFIIYNRQTIDDDACSSKHAYIHMYKHIHIHILIIQKKCLWTYKYICMVYTCIYTYIYIIKAVSLYWEHIYVCMYII